MATRSEDHRGGTATGNQPRIDPVSRQLSSLSLPDCLLLIQYIQANNSPVIARNSR